MTKSAAETEKKPTTKAWAGAFAAYGKIFDQVKKNPAPAIVLLVVYAVVGLFSSITQGGKPYMDAGYWPVEDAIYLIFALATVVYALALADGKRISVKEFLSFDFKQYLFVIAAGLLYILIVCASVLLFIVPAIWTIALFFAAPFIVVDKNIGPIAALKESKRLATGNKGKVWGLVGVSALFSILAGLLAFLPLVGGAASMAVSIVSGGACVLLYRWLQHNAK